MAKVLMIVEGARTDVRLMKNLLTMYGISEEHNIVSYNANIYSLFNQMFRDMDPYEADLLQVLKEHEKDPGKKALFDERYSDVLLIFDLDPQDNQFSPEKIEKMLRFFNESSDRGKLYVNYPMVEAFYHMKSIPDEDYNSYTASMEELKRKQYKERVRREMRGKSYSKFAVNKEECNIIIHQNYEKALMMCEALQIADGQIKRFTKEQDVFKKQINHIGKCDSLYVLCTCIFYILDYDPKLVN